MRTKRSMARHLARSARALLAGTALLALPWAHALELPAGKVVLTVSGTLSHPNKDQQAVFDMKMLEKLPQHSFTTQTPWYPLPVTFTGPLLRDVLEAAGAQGTEITAVALNDYKTQIPRGDVQQYGVIVARLMNNRPMRVREKGPLFIVYPFDSSPALHAEQYYNRSAWQLNALQVR